MRLPEAELARKKSELAQLLARRSEWVAAQERALADKRELERLLGLDAIPVAASAAVEDAECLAKEELKRPQEQAEKKRRTAVMLAKKLEQLSRSKAQAAKRKREEAASEETASAPKRVATAPATQAPPTLSTGMLHKFARAPPQLTASPSWERAALFRIATRHFVQTGQRISALELAEAFAAYAGRPVPLSEAALSLELADDASVDAGRERESPVWCPGGQSFEFSTFVSGKSDRVKAFIDLEKQAVESACVPVEREQLETADAANARRVRFAARQSALLLNVTGGARSAAASAPSSVCAVLSDAIGNRGQRRSSSHGRTAKRPHRQRQFAALFAEMEAQLRELGAATGNSDTRSSSRDVTAASTLSAVAVKPFSLEHDSVLQQVRSYGHSQAEAAATGAMGIRRAGRKKKLDPMNGVCNDENCPYQHQRDFDETSAGGDDGDDDNSHASGLSREQMGLLQKFVELRSKLARKWPVITGRGLPPVSAPPSGASADASRGDPRDSGQESSAARQAVDTRDAVDASDGAGEFLQLEDYDETSVGSAASAAEGGAVGRYCQSGDAVDSSTTALEARIASHPEDTDAWLLLAVHQLDFELALSDDTARVSESTRLLEQLTAIFQCIHLKAFSGSSTPVLDEAKLQLSLHTLSRAIEIEANAYCEALWLLYLHLSSLLPVRDFDVEFEMTEQANQFIPGSHRLWVRYMAAGRLESTKFSEALHSKALCHVATAGSFPRGDKAASLSGLLTAIVVHLCIKLHSAGRTRRGLELLAALLQLPAAATTTAATAPVEWCEVVRGCMSWGDLTTLSMVFAHMLLFDELPSHMHKWLRVSGGQPVHIPAFVYTVEVFQSDSGRLTRLPLDDVCAGAAAYARAFDLIDQSDVASQRFLDVVVNNRLILEAFLDARERRSGGAEFERFVHEQRPLLTTLPGSCFTAAKLLLVGCDPGRSTAARQLLLDMLDHAAGDKFPEALHYYLCALRGFQEAFAAAAVAQLYVDVDAAVRVAATVRTVDRNELARAVADVKAETNPFATAKMLKRLLFRLYTAWMDELAAASGAGEETTTTAGSVDVHVALSICQLMSVLLAPSVAVEAVELLLRSSKLKSLGAEARQLVWSLRFVLEMDVAAHTQAEPSVRAASVQLFRRYMESMNVAAEAVAVATSRISRAAARDGIQAAVFECLYPQHSPWLLLGENLALFDLCAMSVPEFELPRHFRSYHYWLSPSPEFCVSYAEVASQHWEWKKVRQGLTRCLLDSSSHDAALRALVALDVRNRNMMNVARTLDDNLKADPLSVEAWSLVVGMEILFGETGARADGTDRTSELVAEMAKRELTLRANAFNDVELLGRANGSSSALLAAVTTTSAPFHSWGLRRVPNAVLMMDDLVSLDLSSNFLVELPAAIGRLVKLEVLNVSQNALLELPASLSQLSALRVLDASHNNLRTVPAGLWVHLLALEQLDLSANVIAHLPAPPLARLHALRSLQVGDNLLAAENVAQIRALLGSRPEDRCLDTEASAAPIGVADATRSTELSLERDSGVVSGEAPVIDADTRGSSDATGGSASEAISVEDAEAAALESETPTSAEELMTTASGAASDERALRAQEAAMAAAFFDRFERFLSENRLTRAEVKQRHPALWGKFVQSQLMQCWGLGSCIMCDEPNDGRNQRYNTMVLCPTCVRWAIDRLQPLAPEQTQKEPARSESKEDE
ncbi:hypothetical protein PybrP1_000482 [[Pythium] brassicae (nom. inval.)]|nr:hypothetical protein PybrP1_000482 [[Pythium] brassicae (nom. inval.)]